MCVCACVRVLGVRWENGLSVFTSLEGADQKEGVVLLSFQDVDQIGATRLSLSVSVGVGVSVYSCQLYVCR